MKSVILLALFVLSGFFGFVKAEGDVQLTEKATVAPEQQTGETEGTQKEVPASEAPVQEAPQAQAEAKEESANDIEVDAEKKQKEFEAMMQELNQMMGKEDSSDK
jgi:hypothetical protein